MNNLNENEMNRIKETILFIDLNHGLMGKICLHYPVKMNNNCLMVACLNEDIDRVKYLLKVIPSHILNYTNEYDDNTLYVACRFLEVEVIELLLNRPDLNINQINRWGENCVSCLIKNVEINKKRYKILDLLLKKDIYIPKSCNENVYGKNMLQFLSKDLRFDLPKLINKEYSRVNMDTIKKAKIYTSNKLNDRLLVASATNNINELKYLLNLNKKVRI